MKKALLLILFVTSFCLWTFACRRLPIGPSLPATPTPTPTYFVPTTTPGCYSANLATPASSLPTTQYAYPNPAPVATPFWTPVVGVPTWTAIPPGYVDDGSYGTYLLKSSADWNTYWTDQGLPIPPAPTSFVGTMVLVQGSYSLLQVCYTATNVIIYQGTASGGAAPPIGLGTPTPIPSTINKNLFLIPASNLPVSFVSSHMTAS